MQLYAEKINARCNYFRCKFVPARCRYDPETENSEKYILSVHASGKYVTLSETCEYHILRD